jgi:hypothetical protein
VIVTLIIGIAGGFNAAVKVTHWVCVAVCWAAAIVRASCMFCGWSALACVSACAWLLPACSLCTLSVVSRCHPSSVLLRCCATLTLTGLLSLLTLCVMLMSRRAPRR